MPKPMIGSGTTAIIELSSHSLPEQCDTVVALEGVGRVRSSTRPSLVRAVQPLRKSAVAAASHAPLPKCFAFMGYPPVLLVRQRHRWAAPRKTDASFFELRAGGVPANPRPSAATAACFAPGVACWVLSTNSSRRYRKEVATRNRSP